MICVVPLWTVPIFEMMPVSNYDGEHDKNEMNYDLLLLTFRRVPCSSSVVLSRLLFVMRAHRYFELYVVENEEQKADFELPLCTKNDIHKYQRGR